jgi:hypothetical protein
MKQKSDDHRFLVSFDEDSFGDIRLFPAIRRTPRKSRGRKGFSGGKLEIREDGLHWRAGGIATPRCEISGHFFLPWAVITSVDIGDAQYTLKALGGALTIFLTEGRGQLYGEFLGSRTKLHAALSSTPLGSGAEVANDVVLPEEIQPTDSGSTPLFGKLSEDGDHFWNGTAWVPAISADGQMFWTGDHWSRHA